jgi:FixJ family two-component response regulator
MRHHNANSRRALAARQEPTMSAPSPTVCVVDDDDSARNGVQRLLALSGHRVECFASARELLDGGHHLRADCLVLDLCMPGIDGLALQEELRRVGHRGPIVFLTGYGDVPSSVTAMKRGAIDYLEKPVDADDLLAAVGSALRWEAERKERAEEARAAQGKLATLTPREREVLGEVLRGLLNKQVAGRLGISEKTVKVHRGRVMEKLGAGSVLDLALVVRVAGLET